MDQPPTPKVEHPAKFSDPILETIVKLLKDQGLLHPDVNLLDVFAGVGKIALIKKLGFQGKVFCNELEEEWALQAYAHGAHLVRIGDARSLPEAWSSFFDVIATSPTYGNRMSDHHNARDKSKRITYKHKLGRDLTEGNSGMMAWGDQYRLLHNTVWCECYEALKPGGFLIPNIKDHIRKGERVEVTKWHIKMLKRVGFKLIDRKRVFLKGMGYGANAKARVKFESVLLFQK